MNAMCRVLGASESGYYRWLRRPVKAELLWGEIEAILNQAPENDNYGVGRMLLALRQRGVQTSRSSVYRAMKAHGRLHKPPRRPHNLTRADAGASPCQDLLRRDFCAGAPGRKLVTDITEIQCADRKLYLAAVLDCWNGEILGVSMAGHMRAELCIRAVENARPRPGAILHSDHGSQFTSDAFRACLDRLHLRQSMGRVGSCFDNARIESFWATLKKELIYRMSAHRFPATQVRSAVFRYIFAYYNTTRVYTTNPGGWPPAVMRRLQLPCSA